MPRMTTPDRTPTELAASRFPLTLTTSGRIAGNSSWCCPSPQTPPRRLRNPGEGLGQVGDCLIIDRLGAPDAGIPTMDVAGELRVRDGAARTDVDVVRVSEQK